LSARLPDPVGLSAPSGAPPVQFSPTEMEKRHDRLRRWIQEEHLDAVLVYGAGRYQADIHWATDWPGGREAYLIWPADGDAALYLQFYNHLPTARQWARVPRVDWAGPDNVARVAADLAGRSLTGGRLGLAGAWPFDQFLALRRHLPAARLVDVREGYRRLRLIRSAEEIDRFRYAARLADQSLESLRHGLSPDIPLDRVPYLLEPVYLAGGGFSGIHYFAAMPMGGPFVSVPAQYWFSTPMRQGDVLITEITACYQGYQAQVHRTYSLGVSPDDAWSRLHEAAVTVFDTMLAALGPGRRVEHVLAAGAVVERLGYTIVDDLVHGADQMPPVLRTPSTMHQPYPHDLVLAPGMVLVIQPNLVDGDGRGLQFGETVLITDQGAETLHHFPRQWIVV
jgi:Xaa-Pro dipeptidase